MQLSDAGSGAAVPSWAQLTAAAAIFAAAQLSFRPSMQRRHFLATTALGLAALPACAPAQIPTPGPTLLTVSGAVEPGNRRALDPALDQLMHKHGVAFERAHAFDFAALAALPAVTIEPTLEYDARPHVLSGPLLLDVLGAAGARPPDEAQLLLRALDGYAAPVSVRHAREHGFIVATHLDGAPIPLGGLGPLWAVFDADRFPDVAARPLSERFVLCPWGLYSVEVPA